jgi:hypothetical protein
MAKKNDKDKLIEIAAKVLSVQPTTLKEALENALEISVLKRNIAQLAEMLESERLQHENEIKELKAQIGRKDS